MALSDQVKAARPAMANKYARPSDAKAAAQIANTLPPYLALFYLSVESVGISFWLSAALILVLSLFTLRVFVLMHDCGHKSLFRTPALNSIVGFLTGVIVGMPQYVWSRHHNFHHATNGNWDKYRGPLAVLSTDQYEQLSPAGKKRYRYGRNILVAPVGAFLYFIFNPRFNWLLGSLQFAAKVAARKAADPGVPLRTIVQTQEVRYWKTGKEYLHMTANNVVLLSIWYMAASHFGAIPFFTVYIISLSLAGAMGLIAFTVQHNFENSYASGDKNWDYYEAALKGTSFLILPRIANWFTADIAYHHVHHLCAGIPNYRLASCHAEYADLFRDVPRIDLRGIPHALEYILWDRQGRRLVSVNQYNRMIEGAAAVTS